MGACIALVDVSDYLPVFCMLDRHISRYKRTFYFRDYSNFDVDQYIRDVDAVDWINVSDESNNIHEETANCISILKQIADKHAPLEKASLSKRRQLAKPWLTKGILTSVKFKQKLYKSHFLSRDPDKVKEYKLYVKKTEIEKLNLQRRNIYGNPCYLCTIFTLYKFRDHE